MVCCHRFFRVRFLFAAALGLLLLMQVGCSQETEPPSPPPMPAPEKPPTPTQGVQGAVTYEDEPVKYGMVQFSQDEKVISQAPVMPDGRYQVPNLAPGTYRVCLVVRSLPPELLKRMNQNGPPDGIRMPPGPDRRPEPGPDAPRRPGPGPDAPRRPGPGPGGPDAGPRGPLGGPQGMRMPPGFLPGNLPEAERKWYEEINSKFGTPEKCNLTCVVEKGFRTFDIDLYDD